MNVRVFCVHVMEFKWCVVKRNFGGMRITLWCDFWVFVQFLHFGVNAIVVPSGQAYESNKNKGEPEAIVWYQFG